MKKKVALLLVLAMVMSILPMNVFGSPAVGVGGHVTPLVGQSPNFHVRNLPVHLNLNDFLPQDFVAVPNAPGWFAVDLRVNLYGTGAGYVRFANGTNNDREDRWQDPATGQLTDTFVQFTRTSPEEGDSLVVSSPLSWRRLTLAQLTQTNIVNIPFDAPMVLNQEGAIVPDESRPVVVTPGGITPTALAALSGLFTPVANPPINIMGAVTMPFGAQFIGVNAPITVRWATEQAAVLTMYMDLSNAAPGNVFGSFVNGQVSFSLPVVARGDNSHDARIRVAVGDWQVSETAWGRTMLDRPVVAPVQGAGVNITVYGDRVPFHSALSLRQVRVHERLHGNITSQTAAVAPAAGTPELRFIPNTGFNTWTVANAPASTNALIGRLQWFNSQTGVAISELGPVVRGNAIVPVGLPGQNHPTWMNQTRELANVTWAVSVAPSGAPDNFAGTGTSLLPGSLVVFNRVTGMINSAPSGTTTTNTWFNPWTGVSLGSDNEFFAPADITGASPVPPISTNSVLETDRFNDAGVLDPAGTRLPIPGVRAVATVAAVPVINPIVVGGASGGLFTVRLEAPVFYNWALNSDGIPVNPHGGTTLAVSSQHNTFVNLGFAGPINQWENVNNRGVGLTPTQRQNTPVDQLRHVLYIPLTGANNRQFIGLADRVNIDGLWLLPEDRASNTGYVDVRASHGWWGITDWNAGGGGSAPPEMPGFAGDTTTSRFRNLAVGNRTGTGLGLSVIEEPRNVISGFLGNLQAEGNNPDNQGFQHFQGVHTSTILLQEETPGSWGTGLVNPTTFEFLLDGAPHPGVRILGARVRLANSDTAFDDNGGARNNGRITRGTVGSDLLDFRGWASALDNSFPVRQGVVNMSQQRLSVFVPSRHVNDVHLRRTLEVRLYVSLEPGFEALYGSDLDVTVGGTGASNLAAGQNTITVAQVYDPITVDLPGGITHVETGLMHRATHTPVSDIVVEYNNTSLLTVGNEIWFYVTSDLFGPATDLVLNANSQAIIEGDSGLQLGQGRRINQPGSPNHGALAFPVYRQPNANTNPVIRLTDVSVTGQLFEGVEYQLVVSGTAVAQNEQNVREARWSVDGATWLASHNVGIFTSRPYAQTIALYGGGGMDDAPPPTQLPAPGVTTPDVRTEIRLWEGMGDVAGVSDPFVMVPLPGTGLVAGFVSARVFAYFLNNNPEIGVEWNPAIGQATISGPDSMGREVTVVLRTNENMATVNGNPVDIATFAGQSGPAGSIVPVMISDRAYLPLRFLANAFGFGIEMRGNVVFLS